MQKESCSVFPYRTTKNNQWKFYTSSKSFIDWGQVVPMPLVRLNNRLLPDQKELKMPVILVCFCLP
jgi:hypothetical protein